MRIFIPELIKKETERKSYKKKLKINLTMDKTVE